MKITGNEPAMPQPMVECDGNVFATVENYHGKYGGLTIRQQFAAMALQGLLANPALFVTLSNSGSLGEADELYSVVAIEHADALIAELNRPTENGIDSPIKPA